MTEPPRHEQVDLRRHDPPIAASWDDEAPGQTWREIDGTLVFADIAGFTALTERLKSRGRIAAEEIIETLNGVFGTMLTIGVQRRGELLKFGGDALLFLFRGPQHVTDACDAAVAMRAALRAVSGERTSVGRLALAMSVGVHSGPVHLFLVGSPTRELLVLGPAADAVAAAEKSASAGQIVVTEQTAARLPAGATRTLGNLRLLRRRTAPPATGPGLAIPDIDPARMATLFPRVLGEYLAAGPPDPEHRIACIAFVRFSGTDAILRRDGPGPLAAALHETTTIVEAALLAEGVSLLATDLDSDGGKFFLGSGVPQGTEDDDGRMLRAMRAVIDADPPLPVQIGVNRGHVFAAEIGVARRGAFSAMGDTTNTAARIMSKAPPGTLYAHPSVLEHSRTLFAVTPAGPFAMKGKAAPVAVFAVAEEIGTREPGRTARLPFVGRDPELQAVRRELAGAIAGAGGVVTITGPTGIGKSRLARLAIQTAPPATELLVRGEPYGASSTYRVFRDPLRRLLGIERADAATMGRALLDALESLAPDLIAWAPLLADVLQVQVPSTPEVAALEPQFRPDRLADAVVRLLETAIRGPLLLVVEEAHWADRASATLLERLCTAAPGRPWAVLAIRRGDEGGFIPTSGAVVALPPLDRVEVERLVLAATEAAPLRPHEIAAVVDSADGNPLYIEEVTAMAIRGDSPEHLPDSVQAAMNVQIDRLHPHSRRILRFCSVLGRSFRREVLRQVLQSEGIDVDAATRADLAAFLAEDGPQRLRFRNSLVRDAAYDGLAYRMRARLHGAAGAAVERLSTNPDADADTLALHFWRAGDAARTWRYARRAGELARAAYANDDAAVHLQRAVEAGRRVPGVTAGERAALWAVIGEVRELAGVLEGSIDAYRRAAALLTDPVAKADILVRRARVHERAGSYTTALRVVAHARRLIADVPGPAADRSRVRMDTLVALIRLGQERPQEAARCARAAADAARASGDAESLVQALMAIDYAQMQLGVSDVGGHTREALAICLEHGFRPRESVARANLGAYAFYAGRWDEAVQWYTSSRQVAIDAGNDFGAAETDLSLGDIYFHQGRLDEAEEALRPAVRVLRASGMSFAAAYGEMVRSRVLLARGALAEAAAAATRVAAEFNELGHSVSALEACLVRAEAATAAGDPQRALVIVEEAVAAARGEVTSLLPRIHLVRGRALLALGRHDAAARECADGLLAARDQGVPFEEAHLLRMRGEIATHRGGTEPGGAPADVEAAARILADLGAAL